MSTAHAGGATQFRHACDKCGATRVDAQLGLEATPDAYVAGMVAVFRQVWRVLRDDGVLFLNLGDSYSGYHGNSRVPDDQAPSNKPGYVENMRSTTVGVGGLKPKDLVGIPWRVAFALQAPYVVPSCVAAERDRAWLAAMFDGEGCIGIRRFDSYRAEKQQTYQDGFVAYTVVTNNDTPLLDRCVELTGFGKVALKQRAGTQDKRGVVSRRDSFGWRLDGNKAIEVVCAIYPYLIAKRKQACIVYTLDRLNKHGHGSRSVPADVQGKKQHLWELIKRCNQREPVDLPSWIEEPKQIVEPGYYLRSDIIWAKNNPMPESVTDRPTKAHEYVFLLTKAERYYWDAEAVREPYAPASIDRQNYSFAGSVRPEWEGKILGRDTNPHGGLFPASGGQTLNPAGRNIRSVWSIATQPYSGAHFATMPEKLVERCVLAGSKPGDLVLDPFLGSGTVARCAISLGRRAVGTDLNREYLRLADERTQVTRGLPLELGA